MLKYHLDKFTVLNHHGLNDTQKCLVAWEEASATCQRVALKHSLARMLRKYLNDTTTLSARGYIPLEVTGTVIEHSVKLV